MGESRLGLVVADLVVAGFALWTCTTTADEGHGHSVASSPPGDLAADLIDSAGQFVTGNMWQTADVGIVTLPTMPVAPTDAACFDLDDDAVLLGDGAVHLGDLDRSSELFEYHGLHLRRLLFKEETSVVRSRSLVFIVEFAV